MGRTVRRMMLVALLALVTALRLSSASIPNNTNDLMAAAVPISYGESLFRQRILAQTEGERDPVGLVLSGGSARAFAHIGVLQYLEEQGIVPDFIISNSMGSIVGILYAAGLSPDQILSIITEVDITQLFDLSIPLAGGVLDISRFLSLVASHLGESLRIEELPIPIMIVCEDLATKRQVRIMEGDMLTVMGAAFALPVYFPPVEYNGHMLVDGGITNLVPLDIAYRFTDTTIVSTTFYEGEDINLRNPLSILNVSIDVGKRRAGVLELAKHSSTIWIRCNVEDFSFMDFSAIVELARRGYETAALQREKIGRLDSRGPDERILDFRASYAISEHAVRHNYNLYQRTKHRGFSHQLFFGIRSFMPEDDRWFLRDEVLIGPTYHLRWKGLWLSLYGGAAWKSFTPMDIYPSVTARISQQVFPPLILEGDVTISSTQGSFIPTLYHRLGMRFRQRLFDERLTATALAWWEQQLDPSWRIGSKLIHGGFDLNWKADPAGVLALDLEAAWQLSGAYDRHFLHTKVDTTLPLPVDMLLHLGYTGRYALDGGGSVPLYAGDGFRTADSRLLSQGTADAPARVENAMVIGRLGIDWQPESFKPTAGELLIFERSSVGLFADLLWNDRGVWLPWIVVGAKISTTVSLLGLNSIPTSVYVGYDSPSGSIAWGFVFGR
ncbi:MAG: patatin-like phospholipase family protein [Sphaerochaetaceae bacterium]|nr:patatin-like phospholipase family protein [Sphaerochaetaceae bacterium]MDX9939325.1 patatin-like phospholipase family protein [Sphaerochaetaceae bacterium]